MHADRLYKVATLATMLLLMGSSLSLGALAADGNEVKPPGGKLVRTAQAAIAQPGGPMPPILGLDGSPIPHSSPIFFLNYPIPGEFPSAHDSAEPSIGVNWNTDAHMFMMNVGVARAKFNDTTVPPSADWKDVTHPLTAVTTLDPMLTTDPITGRTFAVQLHGEHSDVMITDNDGELWVPGGPASAAPSFDHETIAVGPYPAPLTGANPVYPHAVYYCAQQGLEFGDGNPDAIAGGGLAQCARSDNGGLTWGAPLYADLFQCGALHGTVHVGPDGTVYLPFKDCYVKAENTHRQGWTQSKDGGHTWTRVVVPDSLGADSDPGVWTDDAGNVYFGWSHGSGSEATPGGRAMGRVLRTDGQWSPLTDLGAPFGVVNSVFPETIAGDAGRGAVIFLGTSTPGNLEAATFQGEWHLYVSMTFDAGNTWTTVDATPVDPVQRGCVWLHGGSNPCRNLLDFNDVKIDSNGRVVVAIADGCTALNCKNRGGTPVLSRDALGSISRQTGGPKLREASDPAPDQPVYVFARGNRLRVGEIGQVDAAAMGGTPPYTYAWDFDLDGAFNDAIGQSPFYTATTAGLQTIRVQATDADGETAVGDAQVRVRPAGVAGRLVHSANFDAAAECNDLQGWIPRAGFLISTSAVAADNGAWHPTSDRPASAPCAVYHGDDASKEYPDGQAVQLDSPAGDDCFFMPPNARGATLTFNLAGRSEATFDFLFAMVRRGSCIPDTPENKVSSAASFTSLSQWDGKVGDLFADPPVYAAQEISLDDIAETGGGLYQIRFRFVSDNFVIDNGFQIDDIKVFVDDEPPALDPIADQTIFTTDDLAFTVTAQDREDDPLTFSAQGLPEGASFDGATGAFAWSPGDEQEGVYQVTFSVTDGLGSDSQTMTITVLNAPPVAAGSCSPEVTDRRTPVQCSSAAFDPDGTVVDHLWDFGDGTTSTEANPSHTYTKLGMKKVTLTVTDDDGASSTAEVASVLVKNIPPRARFGGNGGPNSPQGVEIVGNRVDPVQFQDESEDLDGSIASHLWSFGDGSTSAEASPSHQYGGLGTFPVTLTVTDDDGDSDTATGSARIVNLLPRVGFDTTPKWPMALTVTQFNDLTEDLDGVGAAWSWRFGDGGTSTAKDPTHIYMEGGWVTVVLTVTDNDGGVAELVRSIRVCMPGADVGTLLTPEHIRLEVEACVTSQAGLPV